MLPTTAILSCHTYLPKAPSGTSWNNNSLSLGCTFIRRDLEHGYFDSEASELPGLGLHFTCSSLVLYSPRGATVWKLLLYFDKFALKPEDQIF